MKKYYVANVVFATIAGLVFSSGSAVSASPVKFENRGAGAYAYPAVPSDPVASSDLGTIFIVIKGTGTKKVADVVGTAKLVGKSLANKKVKLTMSFPNGKSRTLAMATTNKYGSYKHTVKSTYLTQRGIHRVSVSYENVVSVASVTLG